jgi:hypothetical protein
MKTACCSTDTLLCDSGGVERPRYFPRQLVSDADLTLDQQYFRDKMRRHNRLLHGWGVVCGALVCPYIKCDGGRIEPWTVVVQPGYILGPYGDEILIDCAQIVDLRTKGTTGISGETCGKVSDPWCAESYVNCEEEGDYYIAVRYVECQTRPVRVQPGGCGCDETACEYSRWRDGYEIRVMRECPTKDYDTCPPVEWSKKCTHPPECPPCPAEPWVGLAHVTVDDKGMVKINNCDCRRLVASYAKFWWACNAVEYENTTSITSVEPNKIEKCAESIPVIIHGSKFGEHPKVSFDEPVVVERRYKVIDDQTIEAWIIVPKSMSGGSVVVRIVNEYCATAWYRIPVECDPHQDCSTATTPGGRVKKAKPDTTTSGGD